jgi:hypothetical protein
MSEKEQNASSRNADDFHRNLGFEAGETVYTFTPAFTVDDVKDALFLGTYSNPRPLEIQLEEARPTLRVVVQSVTQVYTPFVIHPGDHPLGSYSESPNWKIEGWLMKSGFDPYAEVVRIRIVLPEGLPAEAFLQRIPTNPQPDGEIKTFDF